MQSGHHYLLLSFSKMVFDVKYIWYTWVNFVQGIKKQGIVRGKGLQVSGSAWADSSAESKYIFWLSGCFYLHG